MVSVPSIESTEGAALRCYGTTRYYVLLRVVTVITHGDSDTSFMHMRYSDPVKKLKAPRGEVRISRGISSRSSDCKVVYYRVGVCT